MDSYEKLLEKHNYELVLSLTKNDQTPSGLWARLKAFCGLGKDQEAIDLIAKNQKILAQDLPQLIDIHLDILWRHELYNAIYDALNNYESLPYFSYEVEEKLKSWKEKLGHTNKNGRHESYSIDEIRQILKEGQKDQDKVALILPQLRTMNIQMFLNEIKELLVSNIDDKIKSLLFLNLVEQKVMEEVTLLKRGILYNVVPYELDPPYSDVIYKEIRKAIKEHADDPSTCNIAIELYELYILAIYPDPLVEDEENLLAASFICLAHQYLGLKVPYAKYAKLMEINKDILHAKLEEINELLIDMTSYN